MHQPSVTLLILNWNGQALLADCLPPLLSQDYADARVVVVDNASTDGSVAYVRNHFPQVEIIQNDANLGFARGLNAALRQLVEAPSDYTILLNNDVIVRPKWLSTFVAQMETVADLGVAGCKLLFPNGRIQHVGAELKLPLAHSRHLHLNEPDRGQVSDIIDCDFVTGAVFALPRRTLAQVGLFDEQFSPFYMEEVDYCFRVRAAGLRVVVIPQATAIHDESSSVRRVSGLQMWANNMNRLRFILKHLSTDAFINRFVPAETADLETPHSARLLHTKRQLYLQFALEELAVRLAADNRLDDLPVLQEAFLDLHSHAIVQQPTGFDFSAEDGPLARALLKNLEMTEFDFEARGGIFGRIRTLWHNVAGKWALRHAMQQQAQFNHLVAAHLITIQSNHTALDHLLRKTIAVERHLNNSTRLTAPTDDS